MSQGNDYRAMLSVAIEAARFDLAGGRIPIGAALFGKNGTLLGRGDYRFHGKSGGKRARSHEYVSGVLSGRGIE